MDNPKAPVTGSGGDTNTVDQNTVQDHLRRRRDAAEERIGPALIEDDRDRLMQLVRARRRFLVPLQLAPARAVLSQVASTTAMIVAGLAINLLSLQGSGTGYRACLFVLLLVLMVTLSVLIKATAEDNENWMEGATKFFLAVAVLLVFGQVLLMEPN